MSFLNTKGLNDIQTVSTFTSSASSLGLLGKNTNKLESFLNTAASAGTLSEGKLDLDSVSSVANILQDQGILVSDLRNPSQVLNLINSARSLGINGTNITEKVQAALNIAQQAGINYGTNPQASDQQDESGPPADAGKAITWHKLQFKPYNFKDIIELTITQEINEHARLFIRGTLPDAADGQNQDYVQATEQYTPVALSYTDASGAVQYLFRGVVTCIKQKTIAGLKCLDIDAASYSYLLDIPKHSRSFQRHQEPYSYIFERVNELARQYVPDLTGDVISAQDTEANQTTGKLIIQYQESDWRFLRRIGSHFGIGLTPDVTFDSPKIYFGLPPEPQQEDNQSEDGQQSQQSGPELNVSSYKIRRETANYSVSTKNNRKNSGVTFSENDFTYCEAQSLDVLQLGQKVSFLNLTWYIRAIHTVMTKHAVNNIYTLTTKQGLMQDDLYNDQLSGISLQEGIVKEVVKDQVRVHITDIDAEWDDGATWFFPYTTIYSSPDGSGWYAMPEVGDSVRIYFPSNKEDESVAASAVNKKPSKRGKREDPNTKILSTVYGKQVILTPGGIQIISNGNLLMTLSDEGGLTIKSDKEIVLDAKQDIQVKSQDKIEVSGANAINLNQGGTTFNITDVIQVSGNQVKLQP